MEKPGKVTAERLAAGGGRPSEMPSSQIGLEPKVLVMQWSDLPNEMEVQAAVPELDSSAAGS